MTFIQPNKNKNILNGIIAALVLGIVLISLWLIVLYNQAINLDHAILNTDRELQKLQAANAELKEKTVALLAGDSLVAFAAERGLVQERNPQYLELTAAKKWDIASR